MKTENQVCPICDEGILIPATRSAEFSKNSKTFIVENLEISICDSCDSDVVTPEQSKRNQLKITDHQRMLDGLLSSKEILLIRKNLNLTQIESSYLFGGGTNAFSKYERGDVIQSIAMDRLLRIINLVPTAFSVLVRIALNVPSTNVKSKIATEINKCDYGKCDTDGNNIVGQGMKNVISIASYKKRNIIGINNDNELNDHESIR